jgi:hypothetical protein
MVDGYSRKTQKIKKYLTIKQFRGRLPDILDEGMKNWKISKKNKYMNLNVLP